MAKPNKSTARNQQIESLVLSQTFLTEQIRKDEIIVVGFSGGPDSVFLSLMLKKIGFENLRLVHVNHMLRDEAGDDEQFAKEFANRQSIPIEIHKVDVSGIAVKKGMSIETAGRDVRYEILKNSAESGLIMTAHHRDDNIETVIMNILRGTGLNGLCGIGFKTGNIVRPLLEIPKSEILHYLDSQGIGYCVDKTNALTDTTRNRIRNEFIPYVEKNFNSNFGDAIIRLVKNASDDNDALLETVDAFVEKNLDKENFSLPKNVFVDERRPIQFRVAVKIFEMIGLSQDIERVHFDALMSVLSRDEGNKKIEFPHGYYVYVKGGTIFFKKGL